MSDAPATEPEVEPETEGGDNVSPLSDAEEVEVDEAEQEPSNEAAKYRKRLRVTEAERDAAVGQLDAVRRQIAGQMVAGRLADPADVWRYGTELADVLDEDGAVDPALLTAAVDSLVTERPHLAANRSPRPDPSQGARVSTAKVDSWTDAFKPQR